MRRRIAGVCLLGLLSAMAPVTMPGLVMGSSGEATPAGQRTGFDFSRAPIPALCGLKATRLVDGKHPEAKGDRKVFLRNAHNTSRRLNGRRFHVGVIACADNHWGPDAVVAWDKRGRIVGVLRLGRLLESDHPSVRKILATKSALTVQVRSVKQPDDWPEPHIAAASLVLTRKRKDLRLSSSTIFTEAPTAAAFVAAVGARDVAVASRHAPPAIVDEAMQATDDVDAVSFGGCIGRASASWPTWHETSAVRMCWLVTRTGEFESGYGVFMDKRSWNTFEVVDFAGLAG